ncbi:S-layer homology domain-containing protein [Paenibacillus radicis (ex Xue et al. 2023)]|uniref:S-layer homology domain-containing protein n=1 Tax=Paenibacillus radicis (ex Xue et al. 2023) TaxID=2972489 RepID=A0ABT1YUA6_9BACL|nr:S-layer homology domain-containing protein [Paenibacillus radicis (ex Xue et al. 2023)]MCR8636642.1 S-layer homology domain-containing protein [Paenibacillus radicis (ex Xue et al. 2023)]
MKRKYITFVASMLLGLQLAPTAFAASSVNAQANYISRQVVIEGTANANQQVTVYVTSPSGGIDYIDQTTADSGGHYQFNYTSRSGTGIFQVSVGGTGSLTPIMTSFAIASIETPTAPAAPMGVTATAGNAQMALTWNEVPGATGYNVKRSSVSGSGYSVIAANLTGTTYIDYAVGTGMTYYYVVTAVNASGESGQSNEVNGLLLKRHSGSSGSSSSNGSPMTDSTTTPAASGLTTDKATGVQVDAKVEEITENGKVKAKASIDEETLNKAVEAIKGISGGTAQTITINVKAGDSPVQVALPAHAIAEALKQTPNAVISIQTDTASYNLPIRSLDIAGLAKGLGANSKDVQIKIAIGKVEGSVAQTIQQKAEEAGIKLLGSAIDFNVTAEANGKEQTINDFGTTYVSRTFIVEQALDTSKTTAVLFNPVTGEMTFVPAVIEIVNGKTKVTIKRVGNSIYTLVEANPTFTDLAGHWAKADVELLASKLVVKGTSDKSFEPDNSITRAEFAALLVRAMGLNEDISNRFVDVNAKDWFAGAVGAAAKAGLVSGFDVSTFKPRDTITREQMAVMIARAMKMAGKLENVEQKQQAFLGQFADNQLISEWATPAFAQAVETGIIGGKLDQQAAPQADASRAEAAVMLMRLLKYIQFIN